MSLTNEAPTDTQVAFIAALGTELHTSMALLIVELMGMALLNVALMVRTIAVDFMMLTLALLLVMGSTPQIISMLKMVFAVIYAPRPY